jgi:hypothetical protein
MRRSLLVLGIVIALTLVGTAALAAGMKASRGTVNDPQNTDFVAFTTTGGGGGTAAMVLDVDAKIEGIGKATVRTDASWQWLPGPYSADHPCALVNQTPQVLPDLISSNPAFNYSATVTITSKKGDQLVGNVSGGSVCEIVVFGPASSINQWLVAFEIDGAASTGKFAGDSGQGVVDFKFDSSTPEFVQPFQISLNRTKG